MLTGKLQAEMVRQTDSIVKPPAPVDAKLDLSLCDIFLLFPLETSL